MATNQLSPVKINILVVDDDSTSLAVVSAMLKTWKYQVVTVKSAMAALLTLREQGGIDLVVTDLHMPLMNGFELKKQIQLEFKLPVIIMSSDDKESVIVESLSRGAALYLTKPVRPDDLKNVWQYAVAAKQGKLPPASAAAAATLEPLIGCGSGSNAAGNGNGKQTDHDGMLINCGSSSDSINAEKRTVKKKRAYTRKPVLEFEYNEDSNAAPKKTKVVWTTSLHIKFVLAVNEIGIEWAVPKRILEFMNVPGLTRENVASYLQKYRIFLKRVTDKIDSPNGLSGRVLRSNFASGHDLLFKSQNRANNPNPLKTNMTSSVPSLSFLHHYPNVKNRMPTTEPAPGLVYRTLTNNPPLFGGNTQSQLVSGKTIYHQNLGGGFGTNLISANANYTNGDVLSGKLNSSTNANNNYLNPISLGLTNNIQYGAGNLAGSGTGQFQLDNGSSSSYGGYLIRNGSIYNGNNNVGFVAPGNYNVVQGGSSSGIWNGNMVTSSQLPAIAPDQSGPINNGHGGVAASDFPRELPASGSEVDLTNMLLEFPNEQQSVDAVMNTTEIPTDHPYESNQLLNFGNDDDAYWNEQNLNLGGGGRDEDVIDFNFGDYEFSQQQGLGEIFTTNPNNKESNENGLHASANQPTYSQSWKDDDLMNSFFGNDTFKEM